MIWYKLHHKGIGSGLWRYVLTEREWEDLLMRYENQFHDYKAATLWAVAFEVSETFQRMATQDNILPFPGGERETGMWMDGSIARGPVLMREIIRPVRHQDVIEADERVILFQNLPFAGGGIDWKVAAQPIEVGPHPYNPVDGPLPVLIPVPIHCYPFLRENLTERPNTHLNPIREANPDEGKMAFTSATNVNGVTYQWIIEDGQPVLSPWHHSIDKVSIHNHWGIVYDENDVVGYENNVAIKYKACFYLAEGLVHVPAEEAHTLVDGFADPLTANVIKDMLDRY